MISDAFISSQLLGIPRDRQEINFAIAPVWAFGAITKFTTTYQIDVRIDETTNIEAIDPNLIRGRQVFIAYVEGGEELTKRLAYVIKISNPVSAAYMTPRGEWVQLVDGHWKCLARIPKK